MRSPNRSRGNSPECRAVAGGGEGGGFGVFGGVDVLVGFWMVFGRFWDGLAEVLVGFW